MKKRLKSYFIIIFCMIFLFSSQMLMEVRADAIWDNMKLANEMVKEKNYDEAVKSWLNLVELYENQPEKMNWTNYAMYLEKIGDYYAGNFNGGAINRPLAVQYYDKSHLAYQNTDLNWGVVQTKNKADQLRTVIRVFVEKTVETNTIKAKQDHYIPVNGAYIGIYGEFDERLTTWGYVDPDKIKETFNKSHSMILTYATYGKSQLPKQLTSNIKESGGALQVAMEPSAGLEQVKDDTYIRQWASDAKEAGIPIFLRFGGEMNGNWVEWGLQPELYIEKFQLVHDIMAEEAPNVVMLWSPNDIPYDNYEAYYPGDDYVDWVGVSSYAVPDGNAHTDLSNYDMNPLNKLQHIYSAYGDRKPIMISEGAVAYWAKVSPERNFDAWYQNNMERIYHYLPRLYPNIKAINYFDTNEDHDHYRLDHINANSVYNEVINQPYYLSKVGQESSVKFDELMDTQVIDKEPMTLSTYAGIYDPFINRVEYYINGTLFKTATKMPYNATIDFTNFNQDDVQLIIKVYDSQDQLAGEREIQFTFVDATTSATP
ncbi:glycosyl hydrolase [Vallitalea okinawensis]|uniref:glycosyl hydrolase n=1 Tax=Vallitalea okinawensis TaxID=2078660 RepID=UPI000CFBF9A7|nr:glycosyl hydrolase [Vallitalea okinawensis]